jgi:alkylation response protein AidB-like acyl-CoA dehydrogenase
MMNTSTLVDSASRAAETAAQLAQDVLSVHASDVDARARFPRESVDALAQAGLLGLCQPAALGGQGQGMRSFAAVTEELARACGSTAMIYVMHVAAAQAIGSAQAMKDRDAILKEIANGRHLTTLAFSERGSRSLFWAPVSKLAPNENGFRVSAEKSWVTSAANADSYVASAQRPGADSPLESTVFLVRSKSPGVKVAGRFDGLGLRGNDSSPVGLEDVAVAAEDLISPLGEGANTMLQVVLPWFSIGTAAMSNGLCRAAVAITTKHLSTTSFTHTGSQLRDLPNLRARLAEMSVRTEQARALLGTTLDHLENGSPAAPLFVLQTRLASLQAASDVTDLAMKACGGAAFSKLLGLERVFRDARAGWVMAPTVDHLLEFSGRALTGLPLFA